MSRTGRLLAVVGVVAVVTAAAAAIFHPWWETIVASGGAAILAVSLAGAAVVAHGLGWPSGSPFDDALGRPSTSPERPPELERLERVLGWSSYSGRDFRHRVRPVLAELVRVRLAARYGIDVDRAPERARERLPDPLWDLVAPDADVAGRSPGGPRRVTSSEVAGLVERIEEL